MSDYVWMQFNGTNNRSIAAVHMPTRDVYLPASLMGENEAATLAMAMFEEESCLHAECGLFVRSQFLRNKFEGGDRTMLALLDQAVASVLKSADLHAA